MNNVLCIVIFTKVFSSSLELLPCSWSNKISACEAFIHLELAHNLYLIYISFIELDTTMNFRILHRCDGMVAASSILLQILLSASSANAAREGTSQDLRQMFEVMEQNTLYWARHMESILLEKCNETTIQACSEGNYNGCLGEFPYATCPGVRLHMLKNRKAIEVP